MPVLWYVYKEIDSLIQQRQFFFSGWALRALCACGDARADALNVLSLRFLRVLTTHRPRDRQPQVLSPRDQEAARSS